MTKKYALGFRYDASRRIGSWVCFPEGQSDLSGEGVLKGIVPDTDMTSLELTAMINALNSCNREGCVIYTGNTVLKNGPSDTDTEGQKALWEQLKSVSSDESKCGLHAVSVNHVKHPDTKVITRLAKKAAFEVFQNLIDDFPPISLDPVNQESSSEEENTAPVEAETKPFLKIKEPKEIKAEPLSEVEGKISVMSDLIQGMKAEVPGLVDAPSESTCIGHDRNESLDVPDEFRNLRMHKSQLQIVADALEVYARLGMGQMSGMSELVMSGHIPVGDDIKKSQMAAKAKAFDKKMAEAEKALGLTDRSGKGIFSESIPGTVKTAWDMYKSITDPHATKMEIVGEIDFRLKIS